MLFRSIGGTTPGVHLKFQGETGLLLMCNGNIGIPLQMKQGNGPSSREEEWKTRLFLSCCETQYFSHVGTGITWTFQSCIKGVKYPFTFLEGTWDFSGDTALEKGHISRCGEQLVFFLKVWQEAGIPLKL